MDGIDIDAAEYSIDASRESLEEAQCDLDLEVIVMKALYQYIVEPLVQKSKEENPDVSIIELRKVIHDDVAKVGCLLRMGYFKIINDGVKK